MATVSILWNDGSTDKIMVTYSGTAGSSQILVTSEPNSSTRSREKKLKLKSAGGVVLAFLTVSQNMRARSYSVNYHTSYK